MAKKVLDLGTSKLDSTQVGPEVDVMIRSSKNERRLFERRWYDNNYFDDGFHFRYLQRNTNRIVDLSEKQTVYAPSRAIPKASRQIRGVVNLLMSPDYTPSVFPEEIDKGDFGSQEEYQHAMQNAQEEAKKNGFWVEDILKNEDTTNKLSLMGILTAKHGVSYIQIYPDAVDEKVQMEVNDAFDIFLMGKLTEMEDSPYLIKGVPRLIERIKADERFDPAARAQLSPDNRNASSEIKEAYLTGRYGMGIKSDASATILLKEAYIKEYLNGTNMARIRAQEDGDRILKERKEGDPIIRQTFVAGNITLRDTYLNMDSYPFVDLRFEPGPIYQVPLIERFIPANKSLDYVVSRVERYTHTMVTGAWLKRQGEQVEINNTAGGQMIEYSATPPTQAAIAPIPAFVFNYISYLGGLIEEQGVSTSTLGQIPRGVKAHAAIESLKESEYASLVMATRMYKQCVKRIAEKCLAIADEYFVTPQTVYRVEKGKPAYFNIIGNAALKDRKRLKVKTEDGVVPIKKDYKVDVELEQGMAYTKEGQRESILHLVQALDPYIQQGLISPDAVKVLLEQMLKTYQFGSTSEFMEALEQGVAMGTMTEQQLQGIQVALAQVLKDAGVAGPEAETQRVMENKFGLLQALKESGLLDKLQNPPQPIKESIAINYKDAPEDIKRQMEQGAGFQPSASISPSGTDQMVKHTQAMQPPEKPQDKAKGGAK